MYFNKTKKRIYIKIFTLLFAVSQWSVIQSDMNNYLNNYNKFQLIFPNTISFKKY